MTTKIYRLNAADRYSATKTLEKLHESDALPTGKGYAAVGEMLAASCGIDKKYFKASAVKGLLDAAGVDSAPYTTGGTPVSNLFALVTSLDERVTALEANVLDLQTSITAPRQESH